MTARLAPRIVQLAILLGAIALWLLATREGAVSPLLLPAPGAVGEAIVKLVNTQAFWSAVGVTLWSVARAYAIAVVCGVLAGWLLTRSRLVMEALEPVLAGMFTVPLTLLLPMFILFFGIGPASKIAYGATYAFFPIALNTIAAFGHVEERWLRAARAMGASRWDIFRHVLTPAAFPVLLTGLRIGFVVCFASVLGGETISSAVGVGHNIALAAELLESARMFAWIAFVVLTALTLNLILSTIDARFGKRSER